MNPRYFAGVIVQNKAGQILAIKLKGKDPAWRIPGGKIEQGESPIEAAKRELFEETGLRYQVLEYKGQNECHADGRVWIGYIYHCRLWSGQDQPRITEPHKMESMMWMEPSELARLNPLLAADLKKL